MNTLDEETTRVHIHLFSRDIARIDAIRGRVKFNRMVRSMIRTMLNNLEAKASVDAKPVQIREGDL